MVALATIAKLDGFMRAGRRARRNRRAAHAAIFEVDIDFDSRIATAVENLAGDNVGDCGHDSFLLAGL